MQSGISASHELHKAFQSLVSNTSQRGLLATIANEELLPSAVLSSRSDDFLHDLRDLDEALRDDEAAYVVLRRFPNASDGFVAITYVPNNAPVRQKMLFAATRLTLVRELGIEKFRETIFATEKAELTAEGFKKHDQHSQIEAPLTEEEQSLGAIKRAEAEEGRGTTSKKSHTTQGMSMPVSNEALLALDCLASSTTAENLLQLRLDLPSERISLESNQTIKIGDLSAAISSVEPRYTFFRYTSDKATSILFIYTCPSRSKVKERMIYSSTRNYVLSVAETAGLVIAKRLEASEPADITESEIEEAFTPKNDVKKAFDKPRRPGRR